MCFVFANCDSFGEVRMVSTEILCGNFVRFPSEFDSKSKTLKKKTVSLAGFPRNIFDLKLMTKRIHIVSKYLHTYNISFIYQ